MNKLVFEVNNGRKLKLVQRYDIQNDWINPNGKNAEV